MATFEISKKPSSISIKTRTRPDTEEIERAKDSCVIMTILSCPLLLSGRFLLMALSDEAPARGLNPALPDAAADKLRLGRGIILFYCVHGGQSRDQDCKKTHWCCTDWWCNWENRLIFFWRWYIVQRLNDYRMFLFLNCVLFLFFILMQDQGFASTCNLTLPYLVLTKKIWLWKLFLFSCFHYCQLRECLFKKKQSLLFLQLNLVTTSNVCM